LNIGDPISTVHGLLMMLYQAIVHGLIPIYAHEIQIEDIVWSWLCFCGPKESADLTMYVDAFRWECWTQRSSISNFIEQSSMGERTLIVMNVCWLLDRLSPPSWDPPCLLRTQRSGLLEYVAVPRNI
jgi:hypothetical protein